MYGPFSPEITISFVLCHIFSLKNIYKNVFFQNYVVDFLLHFLPNYLKNQQPFLHIYFTLEVDYEATKNTYIHLKILDWYAYLICSIFPPLENCWFHHTKISKLGRIFPSIPIYKYINSLTFFLNNLFLDMYRYKWGIVLKNSTAFFLKRFLASASKCC